MGASFFFGDLDCFLPVAVGQPGQRVFFLQVGAEGRAVLLKLEKQQVLALAEHLRRLLVGLTEPTRVDVERARIEPTGEADLAWIVGALGAAYDPDDDRVLLVVEEFVETDDDGEPVLDDDGQGMMSGRITRAQAKAFVADSDQLASAGRPNCPWCARPVDPDGHACARMN
jgi:uncharacterized repeat protein (TIGR03847 family)